MRLITDDWRLKLLALALAVLLLGAVAFSQNPPTIKTLQVQISYTLPTANNLIVLNPPTKATVVVTGLADTLATLTSTNPGVTANFDLTRTDPSPAAKATLTITPRLAGVTVQNPSVPYVLDVDTLAPKTLTVSVRITRVDAGWQVTKSEARCPDTPCQVTFVGPASWETGLNAYADFTTPVNNNDYDVLTQPVLLVQNNSPVDLTRPTVPLASLDPSSVEIRIEAKTGTTSRSVALVDSPPTHPPAQGYRVIGVTISPIDVVIAGDANALSLIKYIQLTPVDLTGHTSNATFQVSIPYPNGIIGTVQTATITYQIAPNPNASPSP